MTFVIPRSARFCLELGRWGFDRIGWVSGQDSGTSQIKVNPTHVPDHHCHHVVEYYLEVSCRVGLAHSQFSKGVLITDMGSLALQLVSTRWA